MRLVGVVAGAEHEDEFALLAVGQVELRPAAPRTGRGRRRSGRTGACGACAAGLASVPLRPRNSVRSAGDGARRLAAVDEGDAAGELAVVGVAGEQRAGVRVDLGDDVHQRSRARQFAQHPFPVAGDRQAPRAGPSGCAPSRTHEFHRRVQWRRKSTAREAMPVLVVLEHAVAETVAADVGPVAARGQRRRRPELPVSSSRM